MVSLRIFGILMIYGDLRARMLVTSSRNVSLTVIRSGKLFIAMKVAIDLMTFCSNCASVTGVLSSMTMGCVYRWRFGDTVLPLLLFTEASDDTDTDAGNEADADADAAADIASLIDSI